MNLISAQDNGVACVPGNTAAVNRLTWLVPWGTLLTVTCALWP